MVTGKYAGLKTKHQILFAVIIAFAVISFWRGVWGILDIYLFPDMIELSMWVSLFFGLGILVATHYVIKELM